MYIANPIYDVVFKYLMEDAKIAKLMIASIDKEHHILNMNEDDFPEKFRPIIRKLHKAVESKEMKNKMEMEDGIIDELEDMEREIEALELKNLIMQRQIEEQKMEAEFEKRKAKEQFEQAKAQVEQENEALKRRIEELLAGKKE